MSCAVLMAGCKEKITSAKHPAYQDPCKASVVIYKAATDDTWLHENQPLVCSQDSDYYYIDLSKIINDPDNVQRANWLKSNGIKINFEKSYMYIAATHAINAPSGNITYTPPVSLNTLKTVIAAKGGNFDTDKYDNYLKIDVDLSAAPASRLRLDLQTTFNAPSSSNVGVHSIPLFRSVLAINAANLPVSPEFEFSKAIIDTHETIFFRLKLKNGTYVYYDYTRIPDKKK